MPPIYTDSCAHLCKLRCVYHVRTYNTLHVDRDTTRFLLALSASLGSLIEFAPDQVRTWSSWRLIEFSSPSTAATIHRKLISTRECATACDKSFLSTRDVSLNINRVEFFTGNKIASPALHIHGSDAGFHTLPTPQHPPHHSHPEYPTPSSDRHVLSNDKTASIIPTYTEIYLRL